MAFEKGPFTEKRTKNVATLGVNPGLGLGTESGLNFYKEMLDFYESKVHFSTEEGTVVDYTTQMLDKYGLKKIHKQQTVAGIILYPCDVFCPMDSTTGITTITDNTVSIHHYSCSWIDHNTMSWRLHELKNKLIEIWGEKWIMRLSKLLKR